MAITNGLKIFTNTGSGSTDSYNDWSSDATDIHAGYKPGSVIFAKEMNTALHQTSLVTYAMIEALEQYSSYTGANTQTSMPTATITPTSTDISTNFAKGLSAFIYNVRVKQAKALTSNIRLAISNEASSSGNAVTWINAGDDKTIKIPATMTGFTSITSTNFVGDVTGNVAGRADKANKLVSTSSGTDTDYAVGSNTKFIYFNNGIPVVSNTSKGSSTKSIYLDNGEFKEGSTYAGGTKVTLNNSDKGASTASFYAPSGAGTAGYFLIAKGSNTEPEWKKPADLSVGSADTATNVGDITNTSNESTVEFSIGDKTFTHTVDYVSNASYASTAGNGVLSGTSSIKNSNTTATILRIGYVSSEGTLYLWNS